MRTAPPNGPVTGETRRWERERGLSLLEALVVFSLMAMIGSGMTTLLGTALRSKSIISARTAQQQTVRETLDWMAERVHNAGLNLVPADQSRLSCKDMVVAQVDAGGADMRPRGDALYANGEILNEDTVAGDDIITLGYRLVTDASGRRAIEEYRRDCATGVESAAALSDPLVNVTKPDGTPGLVFDYFDGTGARVSALTSAAAIRQIRMVRIILWVEAARGTSGTQRLALTRDVMFRNPDASTNNWKNPDEPSFPGGG